MADNVPLTPNAAVKASTEEVTTLNGASVEAQHVQRVVLALRTANNTAVDADPATQTTLASVLAAVDALELLATGPDTVYRGTSTGTVDLASGERLHGVLVVPTAGGQVTVTVPGQAADQCPVDWPYAEDFRGGLAGPSDVVIAGAVAYYRVTTYTP